MTTPKHTHKLYASVETCTHVICNTGTQSRLQRPLDDDSCTDIGAEWLPQTRLDKHLNTQRMREH